MFKITPRIRIQEGASWEDIQDGDCYETGYEICDSDGEIIYDFADEKTKDHYEDLNRKEEENKMTKRVDRQRDYKEYLDAVDVVCMGCVYNDETFCENCPVRKTVDKHDKEEENKMKKTNAIAKLNKSNLTSTAMLRKEVVEYAEKNDVEYGRCMTCKHYQKLDTCSNCYNGSRYCFAWKEYLENYKDEMIKE